MAGGTLIGFDFGPRKIGVAIGQSITATAAPLTTLRSHDDRPDWPRIEALIREWQPEAAVVGLPYNMDDTETAIAPLARRFARQIQGRFGLPVHLVDERLTTLEARQILGRKATSREVVDAMAAKLLLETWLSERH
jgi:putative Holliday junction resolvase